MGLEQEVLVQSEDGIEPLEELLDRVGEVIVKLERGSRERRIHSREECGDCVLESAQALCIRIIAASTLEPGKGILERTAAQTPGHLGIVVKLAQQAAGDLAGKRSAPVSAETCAQKKNVAHEWLPRSRSGIVVVLSDGKETAPLRPQSLFEVFLRRERACGRDGGPVSGAMVRMA